MGAAYRYFLNLVALFEEVDGALELGEVFARAVLLDLLFSLSSISHRKYLLVPLKLAHLRPEDVFEYAHFQ